MGQRENIIAWFDQLEPSERSEVLQRLSPAEKTRLQTVLGSTEPLADEPAALADNSTALRKQLLGTPDLFQRVLNQEDVSSHPGQLVAAVQEEIDRVEQELKLRDPNAPVTDSSQLLLANLVETLKNVWHRFSKTFN